MQILKFISNENISPNTSLKLKGLGGKAEILRDTTLDFPIPSGKSAFITFQTLDV